MQLLPLGMLHKQLTSPEYILIYHRVLRTHILLHFYNDILSRQLNEHGMASIKGQTFGVPRTLDVTGHTNLQGLVCCNLLGLTG